jgi:uncharacterized protein (TIGR02466 family)
MLNVEHIFPTLIGFEYNLFSEEENKKIKNMSFELFDLAQKNHTSWLSKNNSPKNTYNMFNFSLENEMSLFIEKITTRVHDFAQYNNDAREYVCSESWVNLYEEGNFQEPHDHIDGVTLYSCVYFPHVPQGSGKIVFLNPNSQDLFNKSELNKIDHSWIYEPQEGMFLIFKSSLVHYVLPGDNKDLRISIASNFVLSPEFYVNNYSKYLKK